MHRYGRSDGAVIASAAKQPRATAAFSRDHHLWPLGCFVASLLAMTELATALETMDIVNVWTRSRHSGELPYSNLDGFQIRMRYSQLSEEEKARRVDMVADEFEGIVPQFEAFYLQSILYAADASNTAFERFAALVVSERDAFDIVSAIQEALTHAAALSRFFWPARKKKVAQARAEKLCRAFLMNGSALEQRDLRNALEHFDERLDDFLLGDPVGYFFPGPMVEPHSLADEAPGQIFRLVDPYEFKFVILGEKYDFLGTRDEVYRVLGLAKEFDRQGSRLPR